MTPNDSPDRATLLANVMTGFDAFMQRMAATHAPEFTEVGMTMSQAKVLYLVQASTPLGMSELAARLGVTVSTASGLVERLVEAGLVDRRDDPADRRQVLLTMTDVGAASLDRMRELNAGHMRAMLDRVATADLATVDRSIRILTKAVTEMAVPAPASATAPTAATSKEPS